MIFETKEKDVQQVGDIKNNNVSIDTNNIDFIVTILSTNLYSKPIESFVRETVSNAWDSHVEANSSDPVVLELDTNTEGEHFCNIQDFGVGLSPERFDKVYKNIGSSTKRSDNTQIGGFGIGRFSALAYSDVVHITSIHEGTKYIYMMYKDGNSIAIDLLHSMASTEKNGLSVKVEITEADISNFRQAVRDQLGYFENLYVIDNISVDTSSNYLQSQYRSRDITFEDDYNTCRIKKYKNFWVNTLDVSSSGVSILLGKVKYPLRIDNLDKDYSNRVRDYQISLKLEIGDIDVTPNREEILYSAKNKSILENKLDQAIQEIKDLVNNMQVEDFSKFSKYIAATGNANQLVLIEEGNNRITVELPSKISRQLTLNNVEYDSHNFLQTYTFIMGWYGIPISYILRNSKLNYLKSDYNPVNIKAQFEKAYLCDLGNTKPMTKRYIRETFQAGSLFIKPNDVGIKKMLKLLLNYLQDDKNSYYKNNNNEYYVYDKAIVKVILKWVINNMSKMQTFSDSSVPTKWIADTKAADALKRGVIKRVGFDWKQNINLHVFRNTDSGYSITTDSTPIKMKSLAQKFKKLTVYGEKGNDQVLQELYSYCGQPVRPNIVEVAPTKVKLLKSVDNFVHIDDFVDPKYALIRNIGTAEFIMRDMEAHQEILKMTNVEYISPKLDDARLEIARFIGRYKRGYDRFECVTNLEIKGFAERCYQACLDKNYFNEDIRGLYRKHEKELKNLEPLHNLVGTYIGSDNRNILTDYVLSRKLIRPCTFAVQKLRKETIFNIKETE